MRGTPYGEKLLVASLVRILRAGTQETLGVASVLVYEKKLEKNGYSSSKMQHFQ